MPSSSTSDPRAPGNDARRLGVRDWTYRGQLMMWPRVCTTWHVGQRAKGVDPLRFRLSHRSFDIDDESPQILKRLCKRYYDLLLRLLSPVHRPWGNLVITRSVFRFRYFYRRAFSTYEYKHPRPAVERLVTALHSFSFI